jgi:hypothetical protein
LKTNILNFPLPGMIFGLDFLLTLKKEKYIFV